MTTDPTPSSRKRRRRIVVAALLAAALGSAWRMHHNSRTTPTCTTSGSGPRPRPTAATPRPRPPSASSSPKAASSPAPGRGAIVGSEIGGKVIRLLVGEKDIVHAGDTIAEIDCDEERAAVVEAQARLAEVDVDIPLFESRLARVTRLAPTGGVSVDELELRQRDVLAVQARRQALLATLERLQAHVGKANVRAPIDGTVTTRFAHPGQIIEPNGKLLTIVDLTKTRIEAEVNEFDAPAITLGTAPPSPPKATPTNAGKPPSKRSPTRSTPARCAPGPGRPTDTGVLLVKLVPQGTVPFKLNQRTRNHHRIPRPLIG